MYFVCVNFIHKWRNLEFKVDSEQQIFEKLFMVILFIYRRRNIFIFSSSCLTVGLNLGLTSNKPTHYLLDYGDFLDFVNKTKKEVMKNVKNPRIALGT